MQCNIPLHVISCHMHNECYMDNTIHTTYRVSWTITSPAYDFHTSFHSCQYIMHAYINITYNMSFYAQVMTHTQSSQVMATRTYQFITCQYIITLILTSKQVTTLSSNDTLNQVTQWPPKQAIHNHKPGNEIDPKQAMTTGLK